MIRTLRRTLILLTGTLGFAAVTTAPAWALGGGNHCEPLTHAVPTR